MSSDSLTLNHTIYDDLESQIINALIFNSDDRPLILSKVKLEHFNDQTNRILFKIMNDLLKTGQNIDPLFIKNAILNGDWDNKAQIIQRISSDIYTYGYVDEIENKIKMLTNINVKQKLDSFAKQMIESNVDPLNPTELFNKWQEKFSEIVEEQELDQLKHFGDEVELYKLKIIESANNQHDALTGVTSGYEGIDAYTNGWQNGDLIILAARPSVGKTALAINFIINAAEAIDKDKESIVMFSLEMSAEQIIQRMLSNISSVDGRILRSSYIQEHLVKQIATNSDILKTLPICIDDDPNLTTMDIEAKLRQYTKKTKVRLVVVDYLQLINSSNGYASSNRVNEVAKISRHLKNLARSLNIPIIAIAQLSRKIETRKPDEQKPMLSDLRESGSIEQDADLVTFIDVDYQAIQQNTATKPNIDKQIAAQEYKANKPMMNFYIEKHRNGLTGTVKLIFNKANGQFNSVSFKNTKGFN